MIRYAKNCGIIVVDARDLFAGKPVGENSRKNAQYLMTYFLAVANISLEILCVKTPSIL